MSFIYKNGNYIKKNYSIREKINHYTAILKGQKSYPVSKEYAEMRLKELTALNKRTFDEPTMIVTCDRYLNGKDFKPRAGVVVGKDNKGKLLVCPVRKRTTKTVILENDITRQVEAGAISLDRAEVYETKLIDGLKPLSKSDIQKLKAIHDKK